MIGGSIFAAPAALAATLATPVSKQLLQLVQSDVLAYFRRERLLPGVERRLHYITKLYDEEVHLLARPGIAGVQDLAGQKVNVDVRGSGTAMTASVLFGALGVPVQAVHDDQATAVEKLKRGEIAALVYVTGKPARLFSALDASAGLPVT